MGLFNRSKKPKARPLLAPSGSDFDYNLGDREFETFTITEERRKALGIPSEDLQSYMDAGYATALGLDEQETFLA